MPFAILWTPERDAAMLRLRSDGATWDAIARVFGISRNSVLDRSRIYGVPRERATSSLRLAQTAEPETRIDISDTRLPLPPGDPVSWGAITERTLLAGSPFQAAEADQGPLTR